MTPKTVYNDDPTKYIQVKSPETRWMPLSYDLQCELLKEVGLYDEKYRIPANCWPEHNGQGMSRVFRMSYHSPYHCDSYQDSNFEDWKKHACPYVLYDPTNPKFLPHTMFGGTPTEADFTMHRVDKPDNADNTAMNILRANMSDRFGFTGKHRVGQQFRDCNLLQTMFDFHPENSCKDTIPTQTRNKVFISNFLAYARNHAIIAL